MAEQRLIDATDLIARGNASFGGVSDAVLLKKFVDAQPTIDPETIPVVRQLREELDRVKAERDEAVKDLEQAITIYRDIEGWDILCRFCKGKSCKGGGDCKPEWRGPRKEE